MPIDETAYGRLLKMCRTIYRYAATSPTNMTPLQLHVGVDVFLDITLNPRHPPVALLAPGQEYIDTFTADDGRVFVRGVLFGRASVVGDDELQNREVVVHDKEGELFRFIDDGSDEAWAGDRNTPDGYKAFVMKITRGRYQFASARSTS